MATLFFSVFVGMIAVVVYPVLTCVVLADAKEDSRRRLERWRIATFCMTVILTIWTSLWARPYGDSLFIAQGPLWVFCGLGSALIAVQTLLLRKKV